MRPIVVCLGRFGDVLNALPMARVLCERYGIQQIDFLVSSEFASVLEGVSYVRPLEFPRDYSELLPAISFAKARGFTPFLAQVYGSPAFHNHWTPSYQTEPWYNANLIDAFGSWPVIIDRRSQEREARLVKSVCPDAPLILVSPQSISSPISKLDDLIERMYHEFPDHAVLNISQIRGERIFDVLGIMDRAELLISVDTVHLHLAQAARCPVMSILNDGWRGSVPPWATVREFRYSSVTTDAVIAETAIFLNKRPGRVIHVSDIHGNSDRHERAQFTWPKNGVYKRAWGRNAKAIGETRALPYLKDVLGTALERAKLHDTILFTNDDVTIHPGALEMFSRHCDVFGFGCIRRDPSHMGREAFCFNAEWLRRHLPDMPDVILAVSKWDLVIARWMRNFCGIKTTMRNLIIDFYPVDIPPGLITHEEHASSWLGAEAEKSPATLWNLRLWQELK